MTNRQCSAVKVNDVVQKMAAQLRILAAELDDQSFAAIENHALAAANEAVRIALEAELQTRADKLPERLCVDGISYRQHQPGRVDYHSLCGPLSVQRATYRRMGERNGPTIVALELEAGLMQRATPALAFAVAQGHAKSPSRDVEQDLRAAHRRPPSRSTVERMGRVLGGKLKAALPRIEPEVRDGELVPAQARGLCLGLDRTTVPMAEDEGESVRVHYRMAYVATVSLTDSDGRALTVRRYAAAAHEGPREIIERLMADVRHALSQRPTLRLAVIQDGAPELWNLMRDALKKEPAVKSWREAIDRYHLKERLAHILELIERDKAQRAVRLARWERSLDRNDRAIYRIKRTIEQYWLQNGARNDALGAHLNYLDYSPLMHYASLRKQGLPVGSGVTEGACKSLIAIRAKRSGQRWRPHGIDAVLAVRATLQSERLSTVWSLFSRQFAPAVRAA